VPTSLNANEIKRALESSCDKNGQKLACFKEWRFGKISGSWLTRWRNRARKAPETAYSAEHKLIQILFKWHKPENQQKLQETIIRVTPR